MSFRRIIDVAKKPKKVTRYYYYKSAGLFGHMEFQPFIVLTRARAGSNLLVSMLDSHPNIRAEGELFRHLSPTFYRTALNTVFSKQPKFIMASGFKIFYSHTTKNTDGGVWPQLERMENLSVIHLKRRNMLRAFVSLKIAQNQGVWVTEGGQLGAGKNTMNDKRVTLTPEELEGHFERIEMLEEAGDKRFAQHVSVVLYYEDLINDVERAFSTLTKFLTVPYFPPKTSLRKQNPEPLGELIANYDELKAEFSGTRWGRFFADR